MPKKLQRRVSVARPKAQAVVAEQSAASRAPRLGSRRVSPKLLSEFTTQLAVLLDAGIPVTKCLRILQGQLPQGTMRRTLEAVLDDVAQGHLPSPNVTYRVKKLMQYVFLGHLRLRWVVNAVY